MAMMSASLLLLIFSALTSQSPISSSPSVEALVHEHLSGVTKVEDLYPSMFGPAETVLDMKLTEKAPELIWVTGYKAEMVDAAASNPQPDELMCHNTLSFHSPIRAHHSVLGSGLTRTRRLFTLSQGQSSVKFPPGFGIPASSGESFMLQSQVLNLRPDFIGREVRHRVKTEYVPDSDLHYEMKALSLISFGINLQVTDPQAEEPPADVLSCATDAGGQPTYKAGNVELTSHWVVKPGEEIRRTDVGSPFPADTTVHYISVHVHPYAKSLELVDTTTGESVYKANCRATEDGKALKSLDFYSGVEGLKVYRNHRYELISHYENTSENDQTAMAFMFCYVWDKSFEKPKNAELSERTYQFCGGE